MASTCLFSDAVLVFFIETCLLLQIEHAMLRDLNRARLAEPISKIKLL